MSGNHNHNHGHSHSHGSSKNIKMSFLVNLTFTIFELIGGIISNSNAIISDAIHDLGDTVSLGISAYFEKKSSDKPNDKYTFGYKGVAIITAIINTTVLTVSSIIVILNAIPRILNPEKVNANLMIIFSIVGIIFNGIIVLKLSKSSKISDRSVYLHMLEDVLGWIAVLIGAIFIKLLNIYVLDSILAVAVAVFVLVNAMRNAKVIYDTVLLSVPTNIDIRKIKSDLLAIDGVCEICDMHIWSSDGEHLYCTLYLLRNIEVDKSEVKALVLEYLHNMGFDHIIVEIDKGQCRVYEH